MLDAGGIQDAGCKIQVVCNRANGPTGKRANGPTRRCQVWGFRIQDAGFKIQDAGN